MNLEELKKLIKNGEDSTIEFKQSTSALKKVCESLCAFLNNNGGVVIIGVNAKGKIIGQHVTDNTRQEIASFVKKFEPSPNIKIEYIDIDDAKQVIVLRVSKDNTLRPYVFDGRAYERIESTNSIMSLERFQHRLLEKEKQQNRWETWPAVNVSIDTLDHNEIIKTISEGIRLGRINPKEMTNNVEEILIKLGLLNGSKQLNNAAVVLFGNKLLPHYPQCVLRLARFRGKTKSEFLDNKQIIGNVFHVIDEAMTFVNRHIPVSSQFQAGKAERIDTPLFPPLAIREAVINSVAHRDYSIRGSAISVAIYDDRIEIESNGLLPNGTTIDVLWGIHRSNPRNELISNVFYLRGVIEHWGRGTNEIIRFCHEGNYKKPEFIEINSGLVVRLWAKEIRQESGKNPARIRQESGKNPAKKEARQQEILNVLTKFNELSSSEILKMLSVSISVRTLRIDLAELLDKGFINKKGKGPNTVLFIRQESGKNPAKKEARQQEILNVLTKFNELSSSEILAKLSILISVRTLRIDLAELLEKGFINKKGKGPNTVLFIKEKNK